MKKKLMNCESSPDRLPKNLQGHNFWKIYIFFGCCLLCSLSVTRDLSAQEMPEISESAQANEQVSALPGLGFILFACFLLAGKRAYTQIWRKNSMSAKDAQQFREARQRALQELAELDEKYESGQLGNPGYMFARKRRKQQLVELTVLCENYCNVQHPTSNVEH